MTLVREFEDVLHNYPDNNAVVYLDEKKNVFQHFTYSDVERIYEELCALISRNVSEKHCCFGILMAKNQYIPSIVMRYKYGIRINLL